MGVHCRTSRDVCSIDNPFMTGRRQNHDRWVAWPLKIGMWLSAGLLLGGMVLVFVHPPESSSSNLNTADFLDALVQLRLPLGEGLLYAGIMMLISTPVLRVGAAVVTFIAERDWKFVGVSIAVFVVLLLEIILSLQ